MPIFWYCLNDHYGKATGHHGVSLAGSFNLLERFTIDTFFIHDLTLSNSFGCVISEGKGLDIKFDHHRQAPYENLCTEIDCGEGSRWFSSSGRTIEGPQVGAYNVYWNIKTVRTQDYPEFNDWSQTPLGSGLWSLVGVNSDRPSLLGPRRWMETMVPEALHPANLYQAQRSKRLAECIHYVPGRLEN